MNAPILVGARGFTLVEVLVAVAIVAVLASVGLPFAELASKRQKERDLRESLQEIRGALDAYKRAVEQGRVAARADQSGYPPTLEVLVDGVEDARSKDHRVIRFLRRLPRDPFAAEAGRAASTWGKRSYESAADAPREGDDVYDIYSLSGGAGLNGVPYRLW